MSEIRVDKVVSSSGSGAVEFTQGFTVPDGVSISASVGYASTAGIATVSQGLTGTPSITVQNATVQGNLTVNGTTSTINSTTITVDDKNIELGSTASPSDALADGGGITLRGTTDKTLNWVDSTDSWTSSENVNLLSGKTYKINGTDVLTSSQVLGKAVPSGTIVGTTDYQTLSSKTLHSAALTGTLLAGGSYGSSGQFLQSTGTGVQWATGGGGGSCAINVCCTSNFLSCNTSLSSIDTKAPASNNFFVGCNAGSCITTGRNNIAFGRYAGRYTTTGRYNFFGGYYAGGANNTGSSNIFLGTGAGRNNTTGCRNIAIGSYAGRNNTKGSDNAFFGAYAGCAITGGCNVVIGSFLGTGYTACTNHIFLSDGAGNNRLQINCTGALGFGSANYGNAGQVLTSCGPAAAPVWAAVSGPITVYNTSNFLSCNACADNITTSATNNIFVGHRAGRCIISGRNNIGLGRYAGGRVDTGRYNFFGGYSAGSSTTAGRYNVFIGQGAALGNITGCHNIAIGSYAGRNNTIGSYNAFFGSYGAGCLITGGCNVVIGSFTGTGYTACTNHIFLSDGGGNNRLQINNSGALGLAGPNYGSSGQVLTSNGSGSAPTWQTASGGGGMFANSGGYYNTLYSNTAGWCAGSCGAKNFFVGGYIGACTNASNWDYSGNIIIGDNAGKYSGACYNTYMSNIVFGGSAGRYRSGGRYNFFAGSCAGRGSYSSKSSTTGSYNIGIGQYAGGYLTTGNSNVFLGQCAGLCTTEGSNNFFLGKCAGMCNTTGCNNIAIGEYSGADGLYNFGSTGGSNIIVMGNNSHTAAYVKVAWTTGSDARDKTNIIPIPVGRDFLKQLNPVQYQWADRETSEVTVEKPNYGFLAQDILALEDAPVVIVDDQDPEQLKVRETMIIPVLVKTVQELIEEVDALKEEVRILKGE